MKKAEAQKPGFTVDSDTPRVAGHPAPDAGESEAGEPAIEDVRRAFVQLWGAMGSFWGIPPTTAQVHSYLLSRATPQDADEIMDGLELSRGAVSMACRELRDWGLVHVEKRPGARRVTYRPATDLERLIRNIVEVRKRREWDPVLDSLRDWIPRLENDDSTEATIFRQRLVGLEELLATADSLIEGFLRGGLVGRLGLKLLVRSASQTHRIPGVTLIDGTSEEGLLESDPLKEKS